jgi:elongation factor G
VTPESIRSFTLLGASGSGKTALAEAFLYRAGVLHQLGRSAAGGSFLDNEPEEEKRAATVTSKLQSVTWGKHRLHFADTPGFADFVGSALAPLALLDAVVIVVDATSGVSVATQQFYELAVARKKQIIFFINKLDKERADFAGTLSSIKKNLTKHAHPLVLPMGQGATFKGVMDLVEMRAVYYEEDAIRESVIPPAYKEDFDLEEQHLVEEIAETDETLFEKLASGEDLSREEIVRQLVKDVDHGDIVPVLCGSAYPPRGTTRLLDMLVKLLLPASEHPLPTATNLETGAAVALEARPDAPTVAQVFRVSSDPGVGDIYFLKVLSGTLKPGEDLFNAQTKEKERIGHLFRFQGRDRKELLEATVGDVVAVAKLKNSQVGHTLASERGVALPPITFPEPVHTVAVTPKTRKDQDRLGPALHKLCATDPTLLHRIDPDFNETLLSGMGEVHLEFVAGRLKDRYGVELEWGPPHIHYKQTLTRRAEAQGRHKKQTGGHGQFGDCWIRVEPNPGKGFEFIDEIKGGVIPGKWVPSVEAGVRKAMSKGSLGGYPCVDVKVTVYDGSYHSVDSSDMAFQIAGTLAFRKCEEKAGPILLEPIQAVEVLVPEEFVGAVSGDFTHRRGHVVGLDQRGDVHVIRAEVPLSELFRYSTDLRSLTQGAGSFRMEFAKYEPVPSQLAEEIANKSKIQADQD